MYSLGGGEDVIERSTFTQNQGSNGGAIGTLDRIVPYGTRPAFERWVQRLTAPSVDRLGWSRAPGEADLVAQTRQLVLTLAGTVGADVDVVARARTLVEDETAADPDVLAACVQIVAWHGGEREWQTYLERYRTAALARRSPLLVLKWSAALYVETVRGMPLLVLLLAGLAAGLYFGLNWWNRQQAAEQSPERRAEVQPFAASSVRSSPARLRRAHSSNRSAISAV